MRETRQVYHVSARNEYQDLFCLNKLCITDAIVCVVSSVGTASYNSEKKWELFLGSRGNTGVIYFGAFHRLSVWAGKAMPLLDLTQLKIWPLVQCPKITADRD